MARPKIRITLVERRGPRGFRRGEWRVPKIRITLFERRARGAAEIEIKRFFGEV